MDERIERLILKKIQGSSKSISFERQKKLFVVCLLLMDVLMIVLSFSLAYVIRFDLSIPFFRIEVTPNLGYYLRLSLLLIPAWLVLFVVYRLYDFYVLLGGLQEYAAVLNACVSGAILIALLQFVFEGLVVARGWVGLTWMLTFSFIALGRFSMRRVGYAMRRRGYLTSPTLILGVNGEGRLLGGQLIAWPTSGLNVLGYLDDEMEVGERVNARLFVVGKLADLDEIVNKFQVRELILVSNALPREILLDIFGRYGTSADVNLRMSSGLFDLLNTGLSVKEMGFIPLISLNKVRLNRSEAAIKRLMDIVVSLAAILLLGLPMLLIALLIKLDSPGKIIYRRRVMGLKSRQFDAYKFRTMRIDGDQILKEHPELLEELATKHKIKDDPRITRLGFYLRKYSLDELPQFFNILRGEMSLVGPRMISPPELKEYGRWGMNLLTVRPGLTGMWQVSGRSDVGYAERVRLDMFYIRNYSVWLDLHLVTKTIPVVLFGKGAY